MSRGITLTKEQLEEAYRFAFTDGYASADGHGAAPWDTSETNADLKQFIRSVESDRSMPESYNQGRRDVLNAILALNPRVAQKLHMISGGTETTFTNEQGKLPFDVVFWVTEVAALLGIEPKEEGRS